MTRFPLRFLPGKIPIATRRSLFTCPSYSELLHVLVVTGSKINSTFLCLILTFGMLIISAHLAASQDPIVRLPLHYPADVIIFVNPGPGNVVSIGAVYRKRVSHLRVRQEMERLVEVTGAQIAPGADISDASVSQGDPIRYPVTTGAQFTLESATKMNGEGLLRSYLTAFQRWNHVEVIFAYPNLVGGEWPRHYSDANLHIELFREQGAYRYEADIYDHRGSLPSLKDASDARQIKSSLHGSVEAVAPSASFFWPVLLIATGTAMFVGAAIYFIIARRMPVHGSAPTSRT